MSPTFSCGVLERRFTMDRGYLVESRRGGSGCIRIYRIEPEQVKPWRELIESLGEDNFEPNRVIALLTRLVEEKIISRRESMVLKAVVSDEIYARTGLSEEQARQLQRSLFVSALRELLKTGY